MKEKVLYFIKNKMGIPISIVHSELEAKIQIAWFLPRKVKYTIEPLIVNE